MTARLRRPPMRRAVILLPNGFTMFNLFSGIYAIVLASRGALGTATLWILLGGVADALDGRVARATGTGSRFGEELDSLVDAVSFGLAPAMIMYFAVLNRGNWDWLFVFIFAGAAVTRLARFNVEQAGRAKTHFHGLPSPAAGMTLATYYWFSQTPLYNETAILFMPHLTLADLQWHNIMRFLMLLLAGLMVSNVPYPAVPTIGYRTWRQMVGTVVIVGAIVALIALPREFFFPALVLYVVFGAVKSVALGLLDREEPEPEDVYWEVPPDDEHFEAAAAFRRERSRASQPHAIVPVPELGAASRRKRRRKRRGSGPAQQSDATRPHDRGAPPSPSDTSHSE